MSDSDVTIFRAVAVATRDNTLGYRPGEMHPVLIFLRQRDGISPDSEKAAQELGNRGWSNVKISEAASVALDSLDSVHPEARAAYQDASNEGFAALVFSEPITSSDLTSR